MTSYLWILVLACLAGAKAQEFDLFDALDPTPAPPKPDVKPPPKQGGDDFFDLYDALGPDTPNEPNKPAPAPPKPDPNIPPKSGGGGFSDSDLGDVAGGEYKPDPGRGGGAGGHGGHGGRAGDSGYDSTGGGAGQSENLNQLWLLLLRLQDNAPEFLQDWIDNFRQILGSLLEMALDFLDSAEGKEQS